MAAVAVVLATVLPARRASKYWIQTKRGFRLTKSPRLHYVSGDASMSEPIKVEVLKEIFDQMFTLLESLETQSMAALAYLKEEGRATDKKLRPHMEQAANASSVKWRAARVRMEYLLTPIKAGSKTEEKSGESGAQEAGGKKEEQSAGSYEKYLRPEDGKESKSEEKSKNKADEKDKQKTVNASADAGEKAKKQTADNTKNDNSASATTKDHAEKKGENENNKSAKTDGAATHEDMKAAAHADAHQASGSDKETQKEESKGDDAAKAAGGNK
jgi:hypothetical protein